MVFNDIALFQFMCFWYYDGEIVFLSLMWLFGQFNMPYTTRLHASDQWHIYVPILYSLSFLVHGVNIRHCDVGLLFCLVCGKVYVSCCHHSRSCSRWITQIILRLHVTAIYFIFSHHPTKNYSDASLKFNQLIGYANLAFLLFCGWFL